MRAYHMTEQPYPEAFETKPQTLRVNLPREVCDPRIAADRFHRYYDEWMLADELGLDLMVNEHRSSVVCMDVAAPLSMAIMARQTKKARILVLGYPIGHRPDPLRAAEELCTIDCISRGRLEMGFVKGVPYEFPASNQNPVGVMDRFWEAHDFILKAMTSHGEPFNWEGEYFHYRQVNVWPRPVQQPHPPLWSTTGSTQTAKKLGGYGYVMATLGSGYATRPLQDAYRQGYFAKRGTHAPADRFGYLGLVAVGNNEAEARRRGDMVATYLSSSAIVHVPFRNPPGFLATEEYARMLRGESPPRSYTRDGRPIDMYRASVQDLIDAGILFCGTPDQVTQQITDFCDYCGGMGNLLMMGHAGAMPHDDTVGNLTLFAKEVMPALKAYKQPVTEIAAA